MTAYLYFSDTSVILQGMQIQNTLHRHYSASIIISRNKPFHFRTKNTDWMTLSAVIAAPNVEQQLRTEDAECIVFQIEPDLQYFQSIGLRLQNKEFAEVSDLELADIYKILPGNQGACEPGDPTACFEVLDQVIQILSRNVAPLPAEDRRVTEVKSMLRQAVASNQAVPGPENLARMTDLSASRLIHLFKEKTGLTMRRYVLYIRVKQASRHISEGKSLSEAAEMAGFADPAHLSRTFRDMFGLKPSIILKNSHFIQVIYYRVPEVKPSEE